MRATIAILLLAMPFASAHAQRPNIWTADCPVDRMTDQAKCRVGIYVLSQTDRPDQLLSISYAGNSFAVIGTRFGGSARLRVDGNPPLKSLGCDRAVCVFTPKDSSVLLNQILGGSKMLVEYVDIHGDIIGPKEASLASFAAAYREMQSRR